MRDGRELFEPGSAEHAKDALEKQVAEAMNRYESLMEQAENRQLKLKEK